MDRNDRGIMACLFVPFAATALGPIALVILGICEVIWTGSPWPWKELAYFYQVLAVICLPALSISYLLFHFLLRPQIAGRYKNPSLTLGFAGGGGLAFIFLTVMIVVSATCSHDRWTIDTQLVRSLLNEKMGATLILSILVTSSISLGFLAGVFLPENLPTADPARTPSPIGKKLVVSSLILVFLLCPVWGQMFFYWKRSADKAACILIVRNVQQATRSYQGMNGMTESEPIPKEKLIGPGLFMRSEPVCPRGGTYIWRQDGCRVGQLMMRCSREDHLPASYSTW